MRNLLPRFIAVLVLVGTLLVLSPLGSVWFELSVTSARSTTSTMHYTDSYGAPPLVVSEAVTSGASVLRFSVPPGTLSHGTQAKWQPCDCESGVALRHVTLRSALLSTAVRTTPDGALTILGASTRIFYFLNLALLSGLALVLSAAIVVGLELMRRRARRPNRRRGWTLYAVSVIVFVTGILLLRYGGWASRSPTADATGFVSSTWPAILIAGFMLLVGAAALSLIPRYRWGAGSIGMAVGVGIAVSSVLVALAFVAFRNPTVVILPVAIGAAAVLIVKLILRLRADDVGYGHAFLQIRTRVRFAAGGSSTLVAAVFALAALAPVARYGLTSWTHGTNDFHFYVGSAQVWLSPSTGGASFGSIHADAYGAREIGRAGVEKPMSTALLVVASKVSGLPTYTLLTAIMLLLVFVLIAASMYIARRTFGLSEPLTWFVAAIPALSIVPFSRVVDAQPGQELAVALMVTFLALWVSLSRQRVSAWAIILAAILVCATLGSDFTLVVGALPTAVVAMVWLAFLGGVTVRRAIIRLLIIAAIAAVVCAPFVSMFLFSFVNQTSGEQGFDVPLASPLALIGQQFSLVSSLPQSRTLVEWAIALAAVLVVLLIGARRSITARILIVLLAVAVGTFAYLAEKLGITNYASHKWTAFVISTIMPLVLAQLLTVRRPVIRRIVLPVAACATASSLVIAVFASIAVPVVIPPELMALASNQTLAKTNQLNISLAGDAYNALAPLVVPSKHVTVVEGAADPDSPPVGDKFLITSAKPPTHTWSSVKSLNNLYSLATANLSVGPGTLVFTTGQPASAGFLFGRWFPTEPAGTWSDGEYGYVVFDPTPALLASGVSVTVTGAPYAAAGHRRTLTITANGKVVDHVTTSSFTDLTMTFVIPRSDITDNAGRVSLEFSLDNQLSPSDLGQADKRELGFYLDSIKLEPASPTP